MSTLGYGMYGYNVLNPNGETAQMPVCRLYSTLTFLGNQAVGPILFEQACDDNYMLVPCQAANSAYFCAIRTPVAGLYEIEALITSVGSGGGAGNYEIDLYVDKGTAFASTGVPAPNTSGTSYLAAFTRGPMAASTIATSCLRAILFLEKDCSLTLSSANGGGTAGFVQGSANNYFSVRCISTENSGKTLTQT